MNPPPVLAAAVLAAVSCAPCAAQQSAQPAGGEPRVQVTVLEDDATRIEELKVRGQTQRITVQPKQGGMKGYEIIPADPGRDNTDSADSQRGGAGKSVWRLLSF